MIIITDFKQAVKVLVIKKGIISNCNHWPVNIDIIAAYKQLIIEKKIL